MSKIKKSKDGWIRHRGGKCPVGDATRVEVKMRGGVMGLERADGLRWSHIACPGDIMAYRIFEPAEQQAPEIKVTHIDHEAGVIRAESASSSCGPVALEWEEQELDSPIQWRDRIYELAAQQEEITEIYNRQLSEIAAERDSLIQRLESEGFRLIGQPAETEKLEKWQRYAIDGMKINAIKEHRTLTGSGLKEAKDAVEAYQASRD